MSGPPPPPPPPHGEAPKTTAGGASGLPPGKYDVFIIPDHSAGSGFLYLPSLRTNTNSFIAGFATALLMVVLGQTLAPAFQAWWANFQGMGNAGMTLLVIAVGLGAWSLGRQTSDSSGPRGGSWGGGGFYSGGSSMPGAGGTGGFTGTGPSPHGAPPPNAGPPPSAHSPPPPKTDPNGSYQRPPEPPPKSQQAKPKPQADASKNAWEKAREEVKKKEEERKAKEAEERRRAEAAQRLKELREKEARERAQREAERAKREQEAREKAAREQEARDREAREKEAKERKERELREAREKELKERLARDREERRKRVEAERRRKEEEAERKRKEEEAEKIRKEAEAEKKRKEEEAERKRKEEEEAIHARKSSTYAYSGVGERIGLWPNGKPPSVAPTPPPSTKKPPPPTATSDRDDADAYSYRPYDEPKRRVRRPSNSDMSESSYAASQSTARTTPPPSFRGGYATKDPDKIVIKGVYSFMNQYAKTPASQLISGLGTVTDGLILRITTEGLFIDDDVRGVAQREWDVKAWTLKLVETGDWKAKGLHLLRATIRDQEGKRYLFVIGEEEGWKLSLGLQRLRRGTQARGLGVTGLSALETKTTLDMLGWTT